MMKNINIKVNKETRKIVLSKSVIGNDGENLQGKLIFSFDDEFVNGTARLELNRNNIQSYIMLTKVDNTYELPIKSMITKTGKLYMQLVITEGTNENEIPIFKSNVFFVIVNPSINAEIEEPEDPTYPQWIDVANTKLNEIDSAIEEASNLDITASKSGTTTTINFTDKNGETSSISILDGVAGSDGTDGITPTIGDNGNWYLGETDTGKPSRGIQGETGATGASGSDGVDGVSPTVTTSKSGSVTTVTITDKNGDHTVTINDGTNGSDGQDGFSPIANVSQSGDVTTISITDKNGTTTANIDLSDVGGGSVVGTINDLMDDTYTTRINFKKAKVGNYINNKGKSLYYINKLVDGWTGTGQIDYLETLYITQDISNITTLESDLIFGYAIVWQFEENLKLMKFTLNTSLQINVSQMSTFPSISSLTPTSQQFQGEKTFLTVPKLYSTLSPSQDTHLVNKKYVDDSIASSGTNMEWYGSSYTNPYILSDMKKGVYYPLGIGYYKGTSEETTPRAFIYTTDNGNYCIPLILILNKDVSETENNEEFGYSIFRINEDRNISGAFISGGRIFGAVIVKTNGIFKIKQYSYNDWKGIYQILEDSVPQAIRGKKTFYTIPEVNSYSVPTTDTQLVPKKYVDDKIGDINTILATLTTPGGNE